jgi:hypothetical protein
MNVNSKSSPSASSRAMTPDQLNQVLEAIVDGKYSGACILMLRFIGYNPLDYIPYRTYARIMKENSDHSRSHRIEDLGCLEPLEEESDSVSADLSVRHQISQVRGGNRAQSYLPTWMSRWL